MELLLGFGTLAGTVWVLLQVGRHLDSEDDPAFQPWRERTVRWLAGQGTQDLTTQVRQASEFFLAAFDRIFQGRGTLLERSIWLGLGLSPVLLVLVRVTFVVTGQTETATSDLLLISLVLAFGIAAMSFLGTAYAEAQTFSKGVVLGGVLIGVLSGLSFVLVGYLVGYLLGLVGLRLLQVRGAVHPARALAPSLVFVTIVGLINLDATRTFLDTLLSGDPTVLTFVAFNMFADGFSLLETRWVLQRSKGSGAIRLLAWFLVDLAASAVIFLALPIILGEFPSFWEAIRFRGDRPWLGILFWTTFSTSALFYLFLATVLFLILPRYATAKLFRRLVGSFVTVEERPFTAIAWGMNLLVIALTVSWLGYRLLVG